MSQTETVTGNAVTQESAVDLFTRYAHCKSLLDLAVRQDDPRGWLEGRIDEVCQVIADARSYIKSGRALTLPQPMGFGSESFGAICEAILNERNNNAKIKSQAGKVGRELSRAAKA